MEQGIATNAYLLSARQSHMHIKENYKHPRLKQILHEKIRKCLQILVDIPFAFTRLTSDFSGKVAVFNSFFKNSEKFVKNAREKTFAHNEH